jgi:hypothetical protein
MESIRQADVDTTVWDGFDAWRPAMSGRLSSAVPNPQYNAHPTYSA